MNPVRYIKQRASEFRHSEAGVAYIEFALTIGILLIMFFGAIEISRYILIVQKVEKTVDTLTDVLTQALPGELQNSTISSYLNATQDLMNPYTFGANGTVILTDVSTPLGAATPITVQWQVCGGGTLHATSTVGAPGGTATLPAGFTMNAGEEVVIGEIYYNFTPILKQSVVSPAQVYRIAVFKPRYGYGALDNPNTVTSVPCS